MTTQSEAQLEVALVRQLVGQGFRLASIQDGDDLLLNLKEELEAFNGHRYSDREFKKVLNHLSKGNFFTKSENLRDRFQLDRDDGTTAYLQFFDSDKAETNRWQVTHQVTQEGTYKNRYDVTVLANGLPIVQIELKKRGMEMKEAFNQIKRYQRHSFNANHGLYWFTQLLVISNGVNTKYYSNNGGTNDFKQTTYWADRDNVKITDLTAFAKAFLTPEHLTRMVGKYLVLNTAKSIMALRPYQIYATEAIVDTVARGEGNGYIWHTTGSGKTLTSFKASQILTKMPGIHKVVFVVDRKDLDFQTMKEFNSFRKDSVDGTSNTKALVDQLTDDTKLIVTTVQKLNNAVSKKAYAAKLNTVASKKMVFIFDECHRSQFGETHQRITEFFPNHQLFGFTGTPIFAENASKNDLGKRTTRDLFGDCLHKYVITDAIRDEKVLPFGVEYIGRYRDTSRTFVDIDVEAIDTAEVLNSEKRIAKVVDYIVAHHDAKTFNRDFTAILAVSSIDTLITYYQCFAKGREAGEHDLRVAPIFTYRANEEVSDAEDYVPSGDGDYGVAAEPPSVYGVSHSREKLDAMMADYNALYGTSFSTKEKGFENYFKDLGKRIKDREKPASDDRDRVDILLVVSMFLTGFDAKKINTMYVDKNLRYHGLIQAFSRTNRILNEKKSQGNIVSFRNLKESTDEAITLYSNKDALEVVLMPDYDKVALKLMEALEKLRAVTPSVSSTDHLMGEEQELAFVTAFRAVMRAVSVAETYADFSWEDLPIEEQEFKDYQSKYLDLRDKVKRSRSAEKTSVLDDIDFEVELIHRDKINVDYILRLLGRLKKARTPEEVAKEKKAILDMIAGEVTLRSKRELIQKFIEENLPLIHDVDAIPDEFDRYVQQEKTLALGRICEEEKLDREQFSALMESYIYSNQEPIRDDILQCLGDRPSVLQARRIGERILDRMRDFVSTFVEGMVG